MKEYEKEHQLELFEPYDDDEIEINNRPTQEFK